MIVSELKEFIFTRNTKTASTSMVSVLEPYRRPFESSYVSRTMRKIAPSIDDSWPFVNFYARPHLPMVFASQVIPKEKFDSYLKFGVVRDPVTRMASVYRHVQKNWGVPKYVRSLEDFVKYWSSFRPCVQALQFVDIDGRIVIDEVGRYEDLQNYSDYIQGKLGISFNFPRKNVSTKDLEVEITRKCRSLIEDICKLDYQVFDFEKCNGLTVEVSCEKATEKELKSLLFSFGGLKFDPWASDLIEN